ncbi:MAG: hypothetical protein EXS55_03875 [Candidatus Magasanikbacteria bacterium]|nr:hypothetical protein [Candidatus Magasanikbacteria bacterium]
MPKKFSPFTLFIIIGAIVAIIIVAVMYFYGLPKNLKSSNSTTPNNSVLGSPNLAGWQAYSIKGLYFKHPASYAVATKNENPGQSVITVQATGQNRRMVIFKVSDFKNGEPTWVFPEPNEKSRQYLPSTPTEELITSEFGVWLFYATGDEAAKIELHAIFDSLQTN